MIAFLNKIKNAIFTKEELIFFLENLDFAFQEISKNQPGVLENLKEKIHPLLFETILEIQKKEKEKEKRMLKEKKESLLKEKREVEKKLAEILEKEKKLEEKIKELQKKEELEKGTEKEKEIEEKRWELEKKRMEVEKEKWGLKEEKEKIEKDLESLKISREKKENFEKEILFLETLREELKAMPCLTLEVAIDLPKSTLENLSSFLEKISGKKFVFDLRKNPRIIGGAIVEFEGKVRDFSLASKLKKEIFQK